MWKMPSAEADVIVKQRITSQRLIPTAMETRGVVADWRSGEKSLTLYSSTQIPHLMRTLVAGILGMPENRLRVITPEVGGGFGSKLNVYAEEALMGFVAMRIGKPVKWIESRRENFLCTIHGRGHVDYFELAAKRDGTMLGLKLKLIQDLGAYHQLLTPAIPTLSVLMMPGVYNFKSIAADIIGVFTNCVPTDAYRGAGRPEATHGIERMVDMLAAELNMDPADIRLQEFHPATDEFPYTTATGLSYDSGNYAAPLFEAMAQVDYPALRREQAEARQAGRLMGIGISTYGEICAMGPSLHHARRRLGKRHRQDRALRQSHRPDRRFARTAKARKPPSRKSPPTSLASPSTMSLVIHGDTAIVQYGIGTFGSRGTAVGGAALYLRPPGSQGQAEEVRRHAARIAQRHAHRRRLHRRATGKSVSFAEIAAAAYHASRTAAQHGAGPGRHALLGAAQLHLPLRRPHRGLGGGSRDRRHRDQALRGRGRLRQDHQPAAGGRPGARRRGARYGAGAVGAGHLQTKTASFSPASSPITPSPKRTSCRLSNAATPKRLRR